MPRFQARTSSGRRVAERLRGHEPDNRTRGACRDHGAGFRSIADSGDVIHDGMTCKGNVRQASLQPSLPPRPELVGRRRRPPKEASTIPSAENPESVIEGRYECGTRSIARRAPRSIQVIKAIGPIAPSALCADGVPLDGSWPPYFFAPGLKMADHSSRAFCRSASVNLSQSIGIALASSMPWPGIGLLNPVRAE